MKRQKAQSQFVVGPMSGAYRAALAARRFFRLLLPIDESLPGSVIDAPVPGSAGGARYHTGLLPPDGYRTQSADTTYEAEQYYFAKLRELPLWRRAARFVALSEATEQLALAGARHRYPDASAEDLRLQLGARRVGRDTMIRLYEWDPEAKGH